MHTCQSQSPNSSPTTTPPRHHALHSFKTCVFKNYPVATSANAEVCKSKMKVYMPRSHWPSARCIFSHCSMHSFYCDYIFYQKKKFILHTLFHNLLFHTHYVTDTLPCYELFYDCRDFCRWTDHNLFNLHLINRYLDCLQFLLIQQMLPKTYRQLSKIRKIMLEQMRNLTKKQKP